MPGGGQDVEELLPDAACREVAEELGLQIEVKDLAFVIEGVHGENFHRVDLVFLEEEETQEQKQLIVSAKEFKLFHKNVENLQKKYPGRIEDSNIQNCEQIRSTIADYENEELYSLVYGFVAVRPNGDLSFSCIKGGGNLDGNANKWLHQRCILYIISISQGKSFLLGLGISPYNPKC